MHLLALPYFILTLILLTLIFQLAEPRKPHGRTPMKNGDDDDNKSGLY